MKIKKLKRYKVKLTLWNDEVESIIEELNRVSHNFFEVMNYDILIDKLKTRLEIDKKRKNKNE